MTVRGGVQAARDIQDAAPAGLRPVLLAMDQHHDTVCTMAASLVLTWNGKDLPEELRELPAGRYVVEAVDEAPALTEEEDRGLRQALASLQAGKGRSVEQVRQRVDALLRK